MKLLELFKGTGSVGKVAYKLGFDVISLDLDPIYKPHILTDILKWDYKELDLKKPEDYPKCKNTISVVNLKLNDRYSIPSKLIKQILLKYIEIK